MTAIDTLPDGIRGVAGNDHFGRRDANPTTTSHWSEEGEAVLHVGR
jgi:hypothetical protein